MALAAPMLTKRAIVLATVEATYGTSPGFTPSTDGILVSSPDFTPDITILERDYTRQDLSPLPHATGRKLAKMSFTTELRGNGLQSSGLLTNAPILTRLFRGCGYAVTAQSAVAASPVYDIGIHLNEVAWVSGGTLTNTELIAYYVAVDTAGASGTAKVTVTSETTGEGSASQTVTSDSPLSLGTKGLTLTPTFTGSLVVGQRWVVWLQPKCLKVTPLSQTYESVSLRMYLDGTLHEMNGGMGTFTIDATSGQYATMKWDFTGQYVDVVDAALVSPNFERTLPSQVQLGRLRVDDFPAIVNAFNWTQANDIQPRPDINGSDGYAGVRITGRKPVAGIDPEASLVASHDFWGRMSNATIMPFQMRVGTQPGNTVWIVSPVVQYNRMTYRDRSGIRAYDAGLSFGRYNGDDEVMILFA